MDFIKELRNPPIKRFQRFDGTLHRVLFRTTGRLSQSTEREPRLSRFYGEIR